MTSLIYAANAVLLAVLAVLLFSLGLDWENVGFGLHPLISIPSAMFSALLSVWCAMVAAREGK